MRLILFDVDGTLLSCGRQVRALFAGALEEVFGTTGDLSGFDFSGKTDPRIVLELMTAAGLAAEEVSRAMPRVRRLYVARLAAGLRREEMRLLPGVLALLERLAARPEVTVGLLTGNWEPGARIKLARLDIDRFFAFGAFGDDGIERPDLLPVALERAARLTGRRFASADTLLVGDSVRDVTCARAHGARVLAVATGFTPARALAEAGADWVVPDLTAAGGAVPLFAPTPEPRGVEERSV